MSAIVRCEALLLGHDHAPVVGDLTGVFAAGGATAIVGPNGAGKSTLLATIAGELAPLSGRLAVENCPPGALAYLPQVAAFDREFPMTVAEFVSLGLWRDIGALGGLGRAGHARVAAAIATVGLEGLAGRPIGKLSGGQTQRMLFARVVAQDAALILLDEPFNAMDARTYADLLALLRRWRAEGRTLIAVLHDLATARAAFSDALILAREPIAWGPIAETLTPDNLACASSAGSLFDRDERAWAA